MAEPIRLDGDHFWKLRYLVEVADHAQTRGQLAALSAQVTRDMQVRKMAAQYGFPAEFRQIEWNDDTCEIRVT